MTTPSAVLSTTLQRLTDVKFTEIEKQLNSFTDFKKKTLDDADQQPSQHDRLRILLDAVKAKQIYGNSEWLDIENNRRLVDLSKHDPSVPQSLLDGFEKHLRSLLAGRQRSFEFARLYARLLGEWINPGEEPINNVEQGATQVVETHDDFEFVEKDRLEQLRRKFESVAFTARHTDEAEIDKYLHSLFQGEDNETLLKKLQESTRSFAETLASDHKPFNPETIRHSIKGLFKEDLLKEEKKTILQEFEKSDTILNEIADVLNLRFADLENWSWDAPNGLAVEPRRQLNGKYRVMADEDVLQALFLHTIGTYWAIHFKTEWSTLAPSDNTNTGFWKEAFYAPQDAFDQRKYFTALETPGNGQTVVAKQRHQRSKFLLAQLPKSAEESNANPYDEEDDDGGDEDKPSSPLKQRILRRLATDIILERTLHGEVAALQGDLHWFAPGLPHTTMLAVLRFHGVPENWLKFFSSFLKMPLNVAAGIDKTEGSVRIRERGTPIASMMNVFLGEMILFGMDMAVNQNTGLFLLRLHDDFWLSGEPKKVTDAWSTIKGFVDIMGLELNTGKCASAYLRDSSKDPVPTNDLPKGTISMGFLRLNSDTGEWKIDQDAVSAHIRQLRKQLSACTSVFDWISTWNSCIGRFFNFNFGEPAACFGRSHLDSILETHRRIQAELFDSEGNKSKSVSEYLRGVIAKRFDTRAEEIPDAFLFLPQSHGGLGLKNPFVSQFILRDDLDTEPDQLMRDYDKQERQDYKSAKKAYDSTNPRTRREWITQVWGDDRAKTTSNVPDPSQGFISFDEWTAYRECLSKQLGHTWERLQGTPQPTQINGWGIDGIYDGLSQDERWVMGIHKDELKRLFGGPRIVDKHLLPLGVLEMMNSRKVTWQMVL